MTVARFPSPGRRLAWRHAVTLTCCFATVMLGTYRCGQSLAQVAGETATVDETLIAEITATETAFAEAFNRADVDSLISLFATDGEIVDDSGLLYSGHDQLRQLFSGYFEQFPDAQLVLAIDSIRTIGGQLAIEEGRRLLTTANQQTAHVRYIATLVKSDGRWLLASLREFYDEPAPMPNDYLAELEWMVGDWISESDQWQMRVSYRWADGEQFILGDLQATRDGEVVLQTQQRIGWDPRAGKIRSWLFDSDGGLGGGLWTAGDGSWLIRSESVDPQGVVGTSTIVYRQLDANRYQVTGTDRVVGDERLDDFDVIITRAPPSPVNAANPAAVAPKAIGDDAAATTESAGVPTTLVH